MKREASFQTLFNKYIRQTNIVGAFELKQTKTDSLPFAAVKPHQIDGLLAMEENGFVWKISDADPRTKPFDSIKTCPLPAYVVIKYPSCFVLIRIDDFINEMKNSKTKSLTCAKAKSIAEKIVL